MKKLSAHDVALSAISCALATLCLTVGLLYETLLFTGYLFAGVCLMIPLSRKLYLADFLAYLGTGLLSLLFSGFRIFDVLPYFLFFGLHPLVNSLLQGKNKYVCFIFKALWFDVSAYLTWRFVFEMQVGFDWVSTYIVPIILVGGTVFFIFYDFVIRRSQTTVNAMIKRILNR